MRNPIALACAGLSACLLFSYPSPSLPQAPSGPTTLLPGERPLCADSIRDQATGGCLQAASKPAPGLLFPPPHDGGRSNVATGLDAFVGGGFENQATGDRASISGGSGNRALGAYTTVGGGRKNFAGYAGATVAGGSQNKAYGQLSAVGGGAGNVAIQGGTIAGGYGNTTTDYGSTVGGGSGNHAQGYSSTVGGGYGNRAGTEAAVPGGVENLAGGRGSFAAGTRAQALHAGAFVWGDRVATDKPSSSDNQFNVYASGGTRIFSNSAASTGVLLAPGAGSWSSVSDRNAKEHIVPVDPQDVLERVTRIPVSTWNYKDQNDAIRHMGPMAQDFYAAFGLGLGDRSIDTIDPDGVALAAIQGLHELVLESKAENARLREELEALKARLDTESERP